MWAGVKEHLQFEQAHINAYNKQEGDLKGFDCADCQNRGYTAILNEYDMALKKCSCLDIRRALREEEEERKKAKKKWENN